MLFPGCTSILWPFLFQGSSCQHAWKINDSGVAVMLRLGEAGFVYGDDLFWSLFAAAIFKNQLNLSGKCFVVQPGRHSCPSND